MTIPAFTPVKVPTLGTSQDTTYRTLEAGFGDGYSQVAIDGLNATQHAPSIIWQALTLTDFASIQAQFDTFAGTTFSYQVPGDTQVRNWRVKKTSKDDSQGVYITLSATLTEAFDLS